MIASAHSADKKVFQISSLSNEVKELRSAFVDNRGKLMGLKKESYIETKMKEKGIKIWNIHLLTPIGLTEPLIECNNQGGKLYCKSL